MQYRIRSNKIAVELTQTQKDALSADCPAGLHHDSEMTQIWLELDDEGFDLDEVAPYLKCAKAAGTFFVHMEDARGFDQYVVEYGPGYCEEE